MILTNLSIIDTLSKGSNTLIDAKCDYCDEEVVISYKRYNRSIKIGGKFSCSHKCASVKRNNMLYEKHGVTNLSHLESVKNKRKKTTLDKYGVEHYSMTDEFKEKTKTTNLEKYGVDNYTKTQEYLDKVKITNLEKYGVEWSLQSEIIKNKSKSTNLEKYGVEKASQSEEIKDKIVNTNLLRYGAKSATCTDEYKKSIKESNIEKYGVDNYTKTDEYKIKSRETCIKKYGVEHHMMSKSVKETRASNNIKKYGVEHLSYNEDFRNKYYKIANHPDYLRHKDKSISIFNCKKGHEFEIHSDNFVRRTEQGIDLCTVCYPIGNSTSIGEQEIYDYIVSVYNSKIDQSYRDGLEIDIYLPELKIGFEYNGLYWHSSAEKNNNYHIDKTNYFKERGIRIIHIWEDDWRFNREIIKSQIKNWLGKTITKIFARKCVVKEVNDVTTTRHFLENNHIQGNVSSKKKIGLYHGDELVSLMTFDQFEGRKKMGINEWNLSRFCNKINTNVIGGASKLLSFFIKEYSPTRLISYADNDWSSGGLYEKLGFNMVYLTKPDYKYIINGKRVHKAKYKKSNLNTSLSESNDMKIKGIDRIYDCGKIKYEKIFD